MANGEVVLSLIGRMSEDDLSELKSAISSDLNSHRIVLDLKDLTLVDRAIVHYLGQCEADTIRLKHCPAYIREWIDAERKQKSRRKK